LITSNTGEKKGEASLLNLGRSVNRNNLPGKDGQDVMTREKKYLKAACIE
jgi:hypothetical protein